MLYRFIIYPEYTNYTTTIDSLYTQKIPITPLNLLKSASLVTSTHLSPNCAADLPGLDQIIEVNCKNLLT